MRSPLALMLLLLPCGCASVGALQPAQTLGRNNVQIGVELGEQALVSRDTFTAYPLLGVSARYGLLDSLDVGIRFGPGAFEAQVKKQLTPRDGLGLIVSLAPLASMDFFDNQGIALRFYNFAVPVFIGIPLPRGHQLVLAPRIHDQAYYVGAGSVGGFINNFGLGLSAGVAFRVWKLWLIPEIGVLQPLVVTASRVDLAELSGGQVRAAKTTLQVNFSVLWGNT